jgi:hypothetical protein
MMAFVKYILTLLQSAEAFVPAALPPNAIESKIMVRSWSTNPCQPLLNTLLAEFWLCPVQMEQYPDG